MNKSEKINEVETNKNRESKHKAGSLKINELFARMNNKEETNYQYQTRKRDISMSYISNNNTIA